MINDNLIKQLKAYIKKNYQLIGIPPAALPGGLRKSVRAGIGHGRSRPNLGDITGSLLGFIKAERNPETFSAMLERLRLEKNMAPAQLYKGAWVQKQLYSKIMGERNYRPSKPTAVALGLSLRLDREDMDALLESAGFTLSRSSIFDLVIRFCLEQELYDLNDVNALLFSADQKVLSRE